MNRAKDGGWAFLEATGLPGYTWNPASGCSISDCAVRERGACWAERIVKRLGRFCPLCPTFEPHIHFDRLEEPLKLKKPAVITPVSTGDLFGLGWLITKPILQAIWRAPWHTFAILTKAPQNAARYIFPENVWFGVTVNESADVWRLDILQGIHASIRWAIFEPLYSAVDYGDLSWLDWIVIGPQTRPELQPEREWVQGILDAAPGVPGWMKEGLDWGPLRREVPKLVEEAARK